MDREAWWATSHKELDSTEMTEREWEKMHGLHTSSPSFNIRDLNIFEFWYPRKDPGASTLWIPKDHYISSTQWPSF